MGATGTGKSTFINLASGSSLGVGRGLHSCTSAVETALPFEVDGRWVTLIDTPGFDDTTTSDTEILKMISSFLGERYKSGQKLSGILYMHRISDFRVGGVSKRNFGMFRKLCGEDTLGNVVIVTNMWGEVAPERGEAREAELAGDDRFFKPVLDKGARMARHDGTVRSAVGIIRQLVGSRPQALRIQRELVDENKSLCRTAAGIELGRELAEQTQQHEDRLKELDNEMRAAMHAKDEEGRRRIDAEHKRLQGELSALEAESQRREAQMQEERAQLKQNMEKAEREGKQWAEEAYMQYEREVQEIEGRLASAGSDGEREEMRRQLADLRQQSQGQRRGGFFSGVGRWLDGH
ncbi:hypothetical protein PLICRDRAFT_178817 [Plicaturopsis crispa FD-325 SS-3]|uniref:G domain-containing protein n=1 Tax=Plicaturopsis crispa FD-325 SS-3 TaxID=944288 RepID=A0A0C9SRU6_PLICR|nr:hypothetical protein PLICRDRAFT_178817 [Plicaturopsis crispa FD-325 SS-3]